MPQTHGVVTREMQTAPKAAFVRLLVSHLMRHCAADLTHRDLIRILQLLKDSALGRDIPKPWTQDAALRIIDRFNSHLFGGPTKPLDEAAYWQDQELRDPTYLGVASAAPVPRPRRLPLTPQLLAGEAVSPVTGAAGLIGSDLLPEGPGMPGGGEGLLQARAEAQVEAVRWAYGKAYGVVQDSSKLILGSLRVCSACMHDLHHCASSQPCCMHAVEPLCMPWQLPPRRRLSTVVANPRVMRCRPLCAAAHALRVRATACARGVTQHCMHVIAHCDASVIPVQSHTRPPPPAAMRGGRFASTQA